MSGFCALMVILSFLQVKTLGGLDFRPGILSIPFYYWFLNGTLLLRPLIIWLTVFLGWTGLGLIIINQDLRILKKIIILMDIILCIIPPLAYASPLLPAWLAQFLYLIGGIIVFVFVALIIILMIHLYWLIRLGRKKYEGLSWNGNKVQEINNLDSR